MTQGNESENIESGVQPTRLSRAVLGAIQFGTLLFLLWSIIFLGVLLFRKPALENYFYKKTGYTCTISDFEFEPRSASIVLHDVVIWNKHPFPSKPLGELSRVRLDWNILNTHKFPKKLRLLEVEIERLTVIRADGNRFNVIDFVEAIVQAWGKGSGRTKLAIDECHVQWDYIVTEDSESKKGKRMELLMDYDAYHTNVESIRDLTNPPMLLAKDKIDGFYFFNFLNDKIESVF
ncbi:MAG: hypothetical protein MI748_15145 [Opitutales bacterium]|nr:hypothetical protein [Opitutales bacterium]